MLFASSLSVHQSNNVSFFLVPNCLKKNPADHVVTKNVKKMIVRVSDSGNSVYLSPGESFYCVPASELDCSSKDPPL